MRAAGSERGGFGWRPRTRRDTIAYPHPLFAGLAAFPRSAYGGRLTEKEIVEANLESYDDMLKSIGFKPVELDEEWTQGAHEHARYLAGNFDGRDIRAEGFNPHQQSSLNDNHDRYTTPLGREAALSSQVDFGGRSSEKRDPRIAMKSLMAMTIHRFSLLASLFFKEEEGTVKAGMGYAKNRDFWTFVIASPTYTKYQRRYDESVLFPGNGAADVGYLFAPEIGKPVKTPNWNIRYGYPCTANVYGIDPKYLKNVTVKMYQAGKRDPLDIFESHNAEQIEKGEVNAETWYRQIIGCIAKEPLKKKTEHKVIYKWDLEEPEKDSVHHEHEITFRTGGGPF